MPKPSTYSHTHTHQYENGKVQQKCYTIQKVWEAKIGASEIGQQKSEKRRELEERRKKTLYMYTIQQMATTYEACKDIINIQMETRKRKIEEKAHTKRIAKQRNGNSETVERNRRKKNCTHIYSLWLWLTLIHTHLQRQRSLL